MTTAKKIKVGVFTHDFYPWVGGQGRHIYELYKQSQSQQDIDFVFFSPAINDIVNHVQLFPETASGKLKNIGFSIRLCFQIKRLITKYDLDIVHCHGGPGGVFMVTKIRKPLLFTCHHTYWQQSHYIKGQRWKNVFMLPERRGYKNAQAVIAVSPSTKKILTKHYGVRKQSIHVIGNGFSSSELNDNSKRNKSRQSILFMGRLDERKGIDFLVRAMMLIQKIHPEIQLEVIGEGKLLGKLRQYAASNSLKVHFRGFLKDTEAEKIYPRCFAQVVPSIFEGFGITVLEAMNHALPVIATNVDGIGDIVKDGHNGFLVTYGSSVDLVDAILKLYLNSSLQSRFIKAGRDTLEYYQWPDVFRQTVKLYEASTR